jgi:hypothetical protein
MLVNPLLSCFGEYGGGGCARLGPGAPIPPAVPLRALMLGYEYVLVYFRISGGYPLQAAVPGRAAALLALQVLPLFDGAELQWARRQASLLTR